MNKPYRNAAVEKRLARVDGSVMTRLRETCEVWSAVVYWTRDDPVGVDVAGVRGQVGIPEAVPGRPSLDRFEFSLRSQSPTGY